jgi:hypothetical protein
VRRSGVEQTGRLGGGGHRRVGGLRGAAPLVVGEPARELGDEGGGIPHDGAQLREALLGRGDLARRRDVGRHPRGMLGPCRGDGPQRLLGAPLDAARALAHLDGKDAGVADRAEPVERLVTHVLGGQPSAAQRGGSAAAVERAGQAHLEVELGHGVVELHESGAGPQPHLLGGGPGARGSTRAAEGPHQDRDEERGRAEDHRGGDEPPEE